MVTFMATLEMTVTGRAGAGAVLFDPGGAGMMVLFCLRTHTTVHVSQSLAR
jgi:hypothetical protein